MEQQHKKYVEGAPHFSFLLSSFPVAPIYQYLNNAVRRRVVRVILEADSTHHKAKLPGIMVWEDQEAVSVTYTRCKAAPLAGLQRNVDMVVSLERCHGSSYATQRT